MSAKSWCVKKIITTWTRRNDAPEKQEIIERRQKGPKSRSSKNFPSTFYTTAMTDPVQKAKKLLGWSDNSTEINTVNIKKAFHARVRECHPDKGGSSDDVTTLMTARDLLLANVSWQVPRCGIQNCREAPVNNDRCNFHAHYK